MIRIDVLPDDVLLEIFHFYVDTKIGIEAWQLLVHVCGRWRRLVLGSSRRLNLRLRCTPKTPVKDPLDVWPAFPLLVNGDMASESSPGMENIIAALGQSNRIRLVDLYYLQTWQLEKVLAAMQVPFPELTYLRLSGGETAPVIPGSFLGGSAPRLRQFSLSSIPFPGLPKLLLSATHLVSLTLIDIPHSGYISSQAMVALLCALSSLETLSLAFRSPQSRPDQESRSLLTPKRSILPALYRFHFKGVTEYLEELVTYINASQLNRMRITFFNQIDFDCPRLAQFINRTPMIRALDEAHVKFDGSTASQTSIPGI